MSYRNDHEAALARIDALEQEVATLRAIPTTPVAPRRRSRGWLVLAASTAAIVGGVIGGVAVGLAADTTPHPRHPLASSPVDRTFIKWCADAIQPAPQLDEERTDPRAERPVAVEPIGRTGAPCRAELRELLATPALSPDERDALWKWVVQEDELAGAISRIEVYYGNDPYTLDHYASARQLWVEYDRAYFSRNRALEQWRRQFTQVHESGDV